MLTDTSNQITFQMSDNENLKRVFLIELCVRIEETRDVKLSFVLLILNCIH